MSLKTPTPPYMSLTQRPPCVVSVQQVAGQIRASASDFKTPPLRLVPASRLQTIQGTARIPPPILECLASPPRVKQARPTTTNRDLAPPGACDDRWRRWECQGRLRPVLPASS